MREFALLVVFLVGAALLGVPVSQMALGHGAPLLVAAIVGAANGFGGAYLIVMLAMALARRRRRDRSLDPGRDADRI